MPSSERVYCVAIAFKMTERVEQGICIKFCSKLEQSSVDTIWMIQKTFRDDAVSAAQVEVWHHHFQNGPESVENDLRSGRPATSGAPGSAEHVRAVSARIGDGPCEN